MTEQEVREAVRMQYKDTGSTERPEEYDWPYHRRGWWDAETLQIIKEEYKSASYG